MIVTFIVPVDVEPDVPVIVTDWGPPVMVIFRGGALCEAASVAVPAKLAVNACVPAPAMPRVCIPTPLFRVICVLSAVVASVKVTVP